MSTANTQALSDINGRQNIFFKMYHERHVMSDNLEQKSGVVEAQKPIYDQSFCAMFIVLQGSLNLCVNGLDLTLHPNDYLVVMPCTNVEVKASRCIFFSHAAQAHIIFDQYEEVNCNIPMTKRAFSLRLYHFSSTQIERFKEIYLIMKREVLRDDYPMKENSLRAITKLNIVALLEATSDAPMSAVVPYPMTSQRQVFERFIELLDTYYTHERSVQFYAKRLNMSAKYLSMISQSIVGKSASVVISQYVAFRVKQLLYRSQLSIKQVSEMLNFPTQSFFGRYFKRIVGCSPRQYMKQNCRNLNASHS